MVTYNHPIFRLVIWRVCVYIVVMWPRGHTHHSIGGAPMSNVSDGDLLHAILKDEEWFDQLVPMQVQADAELVARFVADDVSDTQSLVEGS